VPDSRGPPAMGRWAESATGKDNITFVSMVPVFVATIPEMENSDARGESFASASVFQFERRTLHGSLRVTLPACDILQ